MSKKKTRTKNNASNGGTGNDAALRVALAANPGATVAALAFDAGMSVTTTRTLLAKMAADGTAVRTADPDAPRATYHWALSGTTPTTTADTSTPPAPSDTDAATTDTQATTADPAPEPPDTDTTTAAVTAAGTEPAGDADDTPAEGTTTTAGEPVSGARVEPVLRTEATKALWSAVVANPGRTASELATIAELPTSTARKILGAWAKDGVVGRERNLDNPRAADYWSTTAALEADAATTAPVTDTGDHTDNPAPTPAEPAAAPVPPEPAADTTPAADGAGPDTGAAVKTGKGAPKLDKLRPGELRGMVEDHLREHPGVEFSPTSLKKALEESHKPRELSSGAINNALEKLTAAEVAVRTSDTPKRWALADGA